MKKHNPSIPIMLREAQGTSPKVYARYEFGQEKSQSLEGTIAPPEEQSGLTSPKTSERAVRYEGRLGRHGLTPETRFERQANRGCCHDTGQERVIACERLGRTDVAAGTSHGVGADGARDVRRQTSVDKRSVCSTPTERAVNTTYHDEQDLERKRDLAGDSVMTIE